MSHDVIISIPKYCTHIIRWRQDLFALLYLFIYLCRFSAGKLIFWGLASSQLLRTGWVPMALQNKSKMHILHQGWHLLRMKNNSSDGNEKPSIVCYSPLIEVLFFTCKNESQWPTFWVYGHWIFLKKIIRTIPQNFTLWLWFT